MAMIDLELYAELLPLQPDELRQRGVLPETAEKVQRLRALYAHWMQFSALSEKEMRDYDARQFGVCRTATFEDIRALKLIVGQLDKTTADFARWRINQMLEADMAAAREAEDWKSLAAMQKNYIAANRLDRPDTPDLKLDQLQPIQFVPTDDPSVLGIAPKKNVRATIAKLLKKYSTDADYTEMKD